LKPGSARLYEMLYDAYGSQHWWPAADRFEIMAGALLVQRTAWRNAESALTALRDRELLSPEQLAVADTRQIESSIRSAGFFRSKARRLQGLAGFIVGAGGIERLDAKPTPELRQLLLALDGVGEETASAILLYAFDRPVVVIDAYLRRLIQRLSAAGKPPPDDAIAAWVVAEIDDVPRLNELHALVVEHGKQVCAKLPRCRHCAVRDVCRWGYATP
jgi:endonuclease III related protein